MAETARGTRARRPQTGRHERSNPPSQRVAGRWVLLVVPAALVVVSLAVFWAIRGPLALGEDHLTPVSANVQAVDACKGWVPGHIRDGVVRSFGGIVATPQSAGRTLVTGTVVSTDGHGVRHSEPFTCAVILKDGQPLDGVITVAGR